MIEVYFRGRGRWVCELMATQPPLNYYSANGVFNQSKGGKFLLANIEHEESEFLRIRKAWERSPSAMAEVWGKFGLKHDKCRFEIDQSQPYEIEPLSPVNQTISASDEKHRPPENSKPYLVVNQSDPHPKQPWYTPARYFARELINQDPTLLLKRDLLAGKVADMLDKTNIRSRSNKKFNPATIKKAFSKVNLSNF